MTDAEALELARRIINSWRGGPNLTEWIHALADLDHDTAQRAFISLRNRTEHAPTVAAFRAEHRALRQDKAPLRPVEHAVPPPWSQAGQTRQQWANEMRSTQ